MGSCAEPDEAASERSNASEAAIEIRTEDVARFYALYEETGGRPAAARIQRDYLDRASEGLRHLTQVRNVNAENIARAVETDPQLYANARSCLSALPRMRARLEGTFEALLDIYPQAERPPVTILISRGRPLAIAGPGHGVQIALEAMCSPMAERFFAADIDDRFVSVIAHEYVHVQQAPAFAEIENPTVLERSLAEGVAEFVGELISGAAANTAVHASVRGRETEIETRFAADADKTELSDWVDNTTADNVGQLGYWVGYRIAQSYYHHATDKRAAVREMIELTDARAFLTNSRWRPGIVLEPPGADGGHAPLGSHD